MSAAVLLTARHRRCQQRRLYRSLRADGVARLDAWLQTRQSAIDATTGATRRTLANVERWDGWDAPVASAPSATIRHGQGYWVRRCPTCEAKVLYPSHAEYMAGELATACRSCEETGSTGDLAAWPTDQHTVKITGRKPVSRLVLRRGIAGVTGSLKYQANGSPAWPTLDTIARTVITEQLAATKLRADGTRRTLDVSRVIGMVHDMIGLGQPVGAESVTWSQVKCVSDVIGLSTARHRCGLSGYYDPLERIWHMANVRSVDNHASKRLAVTGGVLAGIWTDRHGYVIGIERSDLGDSPSGAFWSFDPNTLDVLAMPMVIRPMASPLAPFTGVKRGTDGSNRGCVSGELEISRGLRIKLPRPTLRNSEMPETLTWLCDGRRWTVTYLKGDARPIGRTYNGAHFIGHALIGERGVMAGTDAHTQANERRQTIDGKRVSDAITRARTLNETNPDSGATVPVPAPDTALALAELANGVAPGMRLEVVGRRYSGAICCSPGERYSFIGSDLDGMPIRVHSQRSAEAFGARLHLLTDS